MKNIILLSLLILAQITQAQTYTVVAENLRLPTGIRFDSQNRLWVVESGYGFNDGAVSILDSNGTPLPVVVGLPSVFDTISQENVGPWHTCDLGNGKFGLTEGVTGQVLNFDVSGFTPGVSIPLTVSDTLGTLEVAAYAIAHNFIESDPYTMALDAAGNVYVADAAANAIIKSDVNGQMSTFATFPVITNPLPFGPPFSDAVPTRIVAKPGGGFYVCQLTGFPFLDGAASVFNVDANGNVSTYATGLTLLTDMLLDENTGDLYVVQFGRFDLNIFDFEANSAKVIRIKANGEQEVVAGNLNLVPGLAMDAEGNLYVSELASGRVLKLETSTGSREPSLAVSAFSMFPNPATDFVKIKYTLESKSSVQINILDVHGKIAYTESINLQEKGQHEINFQLTSLPAGPYWVDIQTNRGTITRQLLIH